MSTILNKLKTFTKNFKDGWKIVEIPGVVTYQDVEYEGKREIPFTMYVRKSKVDTAKHQFKIVDWATALCNPNSAYDVRVYLQDETTNSGYRQLMREYGEPQKTIVISSVDFDSLNEKPFTAMGSSVFKVQMA